MALKFEVPTLDGVDEAHKGLYEKHGEGFRLAVEGLDPKDELKEALRKEREENAASKKRAADLEAEKNQAEQDRQKEKGEFKSLWEKEQEQRTLTAKELADLKDKIAMKERESTALKVASPLSKFADNVELLQEQALKFITHTPEGIKINGPDGSAWDEKKLAEYLTTKYPRNVDGNQASGGGASGGSNGGAAGKTMKRAAFEALDPSGKMEFSKAGGQLTE